MTVKIKKDGDPNEGNIVEKIKVGDKEYAAEDVQNLINQQATATQKTQEVAAILAAVGKYGVDVDTYLAQAEGAFDVMGQLIRDKVIDEKGNVIAKKEEPAVKKTEDEEVDLAALFNQGGGGDVAKLTGEAKVAAIVAKALEPHLGEIRKIGDRIGVIDKTQGDMIRLDLQERIISKFPILKPSDVSQVFATAMNDKSKDVWQHAKVLSGIRTAERVEMRKEIGKELGVNVEQFDANKLKEQEAGGGAGALFQGKKFSFNARPGDENAVDPAKAATEFIERTVASES